MRKQLLLIFTLVALATPVHAITDQERSVLQRFHVELEAISKIIEEAEHAANPNDRRQVNYQFLKGDLQKIQQGILDAVNAERREPRSLPPIEGDYR